MAQSKDRMIATQSQLKMTQEWAQSCGYCLTLKELVTISVVLTDYVENGYSKEIGDRLQSVEDYLKKKGA